MFPFQQQQQAAKPLFGAPSELSITCLSIPQLMPHMHDGGYTINNRRSQRGLTSGSRCVCNFYSMATLGGIRGGYRHVRGTA